MFPKCHGGTWASPQHFSVYDVNEIGCTFIILDFLTSTNRYASAQGMHGGSITQKPDERNLDVI